MAARLPEAIPMRKTTTKIIIDQLKAIFCRNGFPITIVSYNGPRFVSTQFANSLNNRKYSMSKHHPTTLKGM